MNSLKDNLSLYIHIPFCVRKCLYCDFNSYSGMENLMIKYGKSLQKDINSAVYDKIGTIFIGGGTPTYLSLDVWKNVYHSILKLNLIHDMEFTVEGNPGTFSEEKLSFLKYMGVNRLSIGLQSWQNKILKSLGRIHTIDQFLESYKLARKLKFSNINIDIMFGLPNQSILDWRETLKNVVQLNPEHISCYSLIIEKNTAFYNMHREGNLVLPQEDLEREMYEFAVDFLEHNGYVQYEISNFSKPGFQCKHNLNYWNLGEYIGVGAGAHSYVKGYRYKKIEYIAQYIGEADNNNFSKLDFHKNSIEDDMEEFVFMGLRKNEGISILDFKSRFHRDIYSIYKTQIDKHIAYGTLIENGDRLYLSKRGIQVSNSVMCDFILTA
ncbi:radical SAM family heme chaperone HemW [Clostridium tyrobutyricum]|uniref:radical SAM family heme chaperone HemW n=1 Tax=Clostridium tyrobutyricum TaxID=1519 RepID=UPI002B1F6C39|nr:radical SAM family heme chaperone HemW [Clostridium tyrobutyricum]MEA5007516.1 radical SAM family heme chaperone HemW [Clostridium tyrobutyricum]